MEGHPFVCLRKPSARGENSSCFTMPMAAGGLSVLVGTTLLPDLLLFLKFMAFLTATGDKTMVFVKKNHTSTKRMKES